MCEATNLEKMREIVPMLADIVQPANGYVVYDGSRGYAFGQGLLNRQTVAVQNSCLMPGVIFPEHKHDSIEYIICYEGEATFTIDDKEVVLEPGQAIKFEPGQPHGFRSKDGCWVIGITIPADKGYPDASFK